MSRTFPRNSRDISFIRALPILRTNISVLRSLLEYMITASEETLTVLDRIEADLSDILDEDPQGLMNPRDIFVIDPDTTHRGSPSVTFQRRSRNLHDLHGADFVANSDEDLGIRRGSATESNFASSVSESDDPTDVEGTEPAVDSSSDAGPDREVLESDAENFLVAHITEDTIL